MTANHPLYLDEMGNYISALFQGSDIVEFRALREGRSGAHSVYRKAEEVSGDTAFHKWMLSHNQPGESHLQPFTSPDRPVP